VNGNLTVAQMVQQAKEFCLGLTVKQRVLLGGGTVLVAATLWVFVQLIAKPDYKVLYSGLNPGDTQEITARLSARKIPFETSPDGSSVLVPADKLDSARLEVASQPMPHSGRMGFELFDKPNWAGSDFSEKVNYQRALEAELERTLATLSEVDAVRVHLVMPAESLYSERERSAKASGDIASDDSVLSTRVSDLELELKGKGIVTDATRQPNVFTRWLMRILNW
jgi:flagellar M-ring protein FliF